MTIIAMVGNKGGAGKTTIAVNLACVLNAVARTAILDADPQGSALQWRAIAEDTEMPDVFASARQMETVLATRREEYRHLIIDCPPSVDARQTLQALELSNLALIPVQPSPLDLWATVHIDHAIERAREVNPRLRALLVVNQLEPRTRLSRLVRQGLDELGLPAAETAVHRRTIYRTSVLDGKSVINMGSRGRAAVEELQQLISEVITS